MQCCKSKISGCNRAFSRHSIVSVSDQRQVQGLLSYNQSQRVSKLDSPFMAATSSRVFVLSRVVDLSPKSLSYPFTRPIAVRIPVLHQRGAVASSATVSCLSGGVSDEFVSTRKSSLDRGFSVIANMLNRIEPLDNSVISKGVPDSAKDSMKQTISTMLGLIPSDQFSVMVRVSKHPLYRLLFSSIITG